MVCPPRISGASEYEVVTYREASSRKLPRASQTGCIRLSPCAVIRSASMSLFIP